MRNWLRHGKNLSHENFPNFPLFPRFPLLQFQFSRAYVLRLVEMHSVIHRWIDLESGQHWSRKGGEDGQRVVDNVSSWNKNARFYPRRGIIHRREAVVVVVERRRVVPFSRQRAVSTIFTSWNAIATDVAYLPWPLNDFTIPLKHDYWFMTGR